MTGSSTTPRHFELEDLFINNPDLEKLQSHLKRFNPIRVMRMEGMEIRHTNILAWLLDPLETHGLGDRFLKAFLAEAMKGDGAKAAPTAVDIALADLRDAEVRREKKNIDLFVTSAANAWSFVIENKFHSKQHSNQLKRYIEQAKAEALDAKLDFKNRGIFLTLHEEDPDEQVREDYVTLRYENVCRIIGTLLSSKEARLSPEVRQFISHYLEIIRDATDMSDEQNEMELLAKKLYRSHRKVLDFIMDHGATTEFTMAAEAVFGPDLDYGDEVEVKGLGRYMFSWNSDRQFSFLPAEWRRHLGGDKRLHLWKGCEKWWAGYPLICWFQLDDAGDGMKGQLRLFAEVGPLSDHEMRLTLIDGIRGAAKKGAGEEIQFRANADRPGARYSKFLRSTANSIPIADISDMELLEQAMRRLLEKFQGPCDAVAKSLPKFMSNVKS